MTTHLTREQHAAALGVACIGLSMGAPDDIRIVLAALGLAPKRRVSRRTPCGHDNADLYRSGMNQAVRCRTCERIKRAARAARKAAAA